MTSLIDVIFLLLLFFMLTSTFSKYAEVELLSAGSGTPQMADQQQPPLFIRLGMDSLSLNGSEYPLEGLLAALPATEGPAQTQTILVSLADQVNAQRLVDVLAVLGQAKGFSVQVLGAK
ncbi:MAG: biopolymer transporter ExbD [Rhodobacterales bacterium]|nr:MAG: biopolymer transporter ExbD [Rhodobacterales bacterium]